MCTVSMVTDWGINTWTNKDIWIEQEPKPYFLLKQDAPTKEEFEKLQRSIEEFKKEFLEFKNLVKRAIEYDIKNNEPHCEVDEKVEIVRKVAEQLGVSVDDIFPKEE